MDYQEKYELWCAQESMDANLREELDEIRGNDAEIRERFAIDLSFGTAGLRGILGAGSNRMNVYTVRQATQGLADYILSENGASRGVAISYDSRNFSREFALESAKVLCANGIRAYLFEGMRPVPVLSFAVRHLHCLSGIMITASHNPAKYNGYKVYGEDGGQMPPEAASIVTDRIQQTDIFCGVKMMTEEAALASGLLQYIGEDVDAPYLACVRAQSIHKDALEQTDLKVVYTPLHGSGNMPVQRILKMSGMKNLLVVKEQETPDGNFSTVKSPNPEDKECFTLAIELAKKNDVDLIVGTDPDCDRVGIVVRNGDGDYVTFTGNQTGVLLAEYVLSQRLALGQMPENPVLIKTVVTTEMVRAVAAAYGVQVMEVLTGFKFIAEKILQFETSSESYVFGFEESYGYLCGTYARDKDAVVATMLICEMAAWYRERGMTLYDALQSLYQKYGTYAEGVRNYFREGLDGPKEIAAILDRVRNAPPKELAGIPVTAVRDYETGVVTYRDGHTGATNQPLNNMLYFELADGDGWIALRPSGTEPKFKLYFGYRSKDAATAKNTLNGLIAAMEEIVAI